MENSNNFEVHVGRGSSSKQLLDYSTVEEIHHDWTMSTEQPTQSESNPDPELQSEDQSSPPPPSYSIAKEQDALFRIANLEGLVFELDEEIVKIQSQDDVVYLCSHNPRLTRGEFFTFMLRVYKHRANDPRGPKVAISKEIYSVKDAMAGFSFKAKLPAYYSFPAESRSVYCYRPSFSMVNRDKKLRWWHHFPGAMNQHNSSWKIVIHTNHKRQDDSVVLLVRRRTGHHTPAQFQWIDADGKVIALETEASTSLHKPMLELKTNPEDRRLVHALVLGWVTRIWHDANQDYVKRKAREINSTLSRKFIGPGGV
jgi:hypothetical protein